MGPFRELNGNRVKQVEEAMSTSEKKIRGARKRIRQIEELEKRDPSTLNESQKKKLLRKGELLKTLNELLEEEKKKTSPRSTADEEKKKVSSASKLRASAGVFVPSFLKQQQSNVETKSEGNTSQQNEKKKKMDTPDEKKTTSLVQETEKKKEETPVRTDEKKKKIIEETPEEMKVRKRIRLIKKKLRDIGRLDDMIQNGKLKRISEAQRVKLKRKFEWECELLKLEAIRNEKEEEDQRNDDIYDNKTCVKDYQRLCCLGTGSFGKVLQVRHLRTGKIYAMKIIKKDHVSRKKVETSTMLERDVLVKIHHPFIVKLRHAFQTDEKLYLVMTYVVLFLSHHSVSFYRTIKKHTGTYREENSFGIFTVTEPLMRMCLDFTVPNSCSRWTIFTR